MSLKSYLVREEWRDIKGYEGLYQVSNFGRVKSFNDHTKNKTNNINGKILKQRITKDGYYESCLSKEGVKKTIRIHILVAEAFIPNPNNYPIINHRDERPKNNYFENLEWCDYKYNLNYGTAMKRRRISSSLKNIMQYDLNGNLIKKWNSTFDLREETDYNVNGIIRVCNGNLKTSNNFIWRFEGDAFDKYDLPIDQLYDYDKPVVRYDMNANIIKEYNSMREASKELGIILQGIKNACTGYTVYCAKSIWRYKGDDFKKYSIEKPIRTYTEEEKQIMRDKALEHPYTKKVSKKVGVFDLNGNFIKEIPSVTQATKEYGSGVAFVLRGEYSQTRGYKFKIL